MVRAYADRLRSHGLTVYFEGTEHIYVESRIDLESFVCLLQSQFTGVQAREIITRAEGLMMHEPNEMDELERLAAEFAANNLPAQVESLRAHYRALIRAAMLIGALWQERYRAAQEAQAEVTPTLDTLSRVFESLADIKEPPIKEKSKQKSPDFRRKRFPMPSGPFPLWMEDPDLGARQPLECETCDRVTTARVYYEGDIRSPLCTLCAEKRGLCAR